MFGGIGGDADRADDMALHADRQAAAHQHEPAR
jgi:hypothetical protein